MASYRFISVATTKPVLLPQIDEEVAAFYGETTNPTRFHPCYDFLVEVGFAILLMSGKGSVDQESFDAWIDQRLKQVPDPPDLTDPKWVKHLAMLRRFLYQHYTFEAWR